MNTNCDENNNSILGLRIRNRRGIFTTLSSSWELQAGDRVVIRTNRGQELATVSHTVLNHEIQRERELEIHELLRRAEDQDELAAQQLIDLEPSDRSRARQKVEQLKLNMRIVKSERIFDNSRIIFYFLAPQKVDFRELVRVLASEFRMRIELRQISSREHVGMNGAIGSCGRQTCCSTFLTRAPAVDMMMVDTQKLSRHAGKLNGVCGKLKCCIAYEYDFYVEALGGSGSKSSCSGCGTKKKCGTQGDETDETQDP